MYYVKVLVLYLGFWMPFILSLRLLSVSEVPGALRCFWQGCSPPHFPHLPAVWLEAGSCSCVCCVWIYRLVGCPWVCGSVVSDCWCFMKHRIWKYEVLKTFCQFWLKLASEFVSNRRMGQEMNCITLISLGNKDKNYWMNLLFVYGYNKRGFRILLHTDYVKTMPSYKFPEARKGNRRAMSCVQCRSIACVAHRLNLA